MVIAVTDSVTREALNVRQLTNRQAFLQIRPAGRMVAEPKQRTVNSSFDPESIGVIDENCE